MKRKSYIYVVMLFLAALLAGCSTTAHLPEDEVLYTGITDISFADDAKKEKKNKKEKKQEETGVITALNEAYEHVERILSGESIPQATPTLTALQRDSLKADREMLEEASALVRDEVSGVLSIAPNNSLLGSAKYRFPLPFGLWFYNGFVGKEKRFGKWVFNTFSVTPKLISSVNPSLRAKVARNVLHNYGYFQGDVQYDVYPHKNNPRKAKVGYRVHPGQLFRLDSIAFLHFPPVADSLIRATARKSLLHRNQPFTASSLSEERERLNTLFRDNGFYYCQPNFFSFRADTLQRRNWVQLQVVPSRELPAEAGRRYYLRRTRLHLVDPLAGAQQTDSMGRTDAFRMYFAGLGKKRKPSVNFGILRRNILYKKGDLYRQVVSDIMQERFSELGIFSQVSFNCTPSDTTSTCDSLDVDIYTVLDKPYDAEFKATATKKSNGLLGPGLSFGMTRRNAFHGAEALNFQVYGSYEWQTGANVQNASSSVLNSYEYGTSLSLDYPYIKLGRLARPFLRKGLSSTSFKLEADWQNRAGYFGRVSLGARVTLGYQKKLTEAHFRAGSHKPIVKHEFTPFRLDYEIQLHSTHTFDSILQANPALGVSMRNQFVPSMQYVLTTSSRKGSTHPGVFTLTLKEAGNVFSGLYACFGQKFGQADKHLFGVPFAQYIKGVAEFTKSHRVGHSGVRMAGRILLGAVYSYGNASMAPYNDLFTIGGANSIRAFTIRSIGPGSYRPANGQFSYVDQVGDLKFEANVECRFPIVGNLGGAVFLDCGNVWLMKNNENHPGGAFRFKNLGKELALGTGLGLRYDLEFLVVRFDVGVGLHAPYDTGRSGYYNMPKFGKSLGYHLAIGYPF